MQITKTQSPRWLHIHCMSLLKFTLGSKIIKILKVKSKVGNKRPEWLLFIY